MGNTGTRVTLTLRQRNTTTNVLTGATKPNLPGNPDYVSPVLDAIACPIDTALVCPDIAAGRKTATSIWCEISIPKSVFNNPAFAKVKLILNKNAVFFQQTILDEAFFVPNYGQVEFATLDIPATYTIQVQYLDIANVVIFTCPNLVTVTMTASVTWEGIDPFCEVTPSCTLPAVYDAPTNTCQTVDEIPATPPSAGGGTPGTAAAVTNVQWNNGGAQVFSPGYPLNGSGSVAAYLTVPHFWVNGNFQWDAIGRNLVDGRMNWAGVWVLGEVANPINEWIGFVRRIDTPVAKTVYVAMSADNEFRFSLNSTLLVDCSITSGVITSGPNFNYWNIYPVTLVPGANYIEMWAKNTGSVAGFAMEIYDMTLAQLIAATVAADLNILFSTHDMAGQPFDLGSTIGWSCPATYALDNTPVGDPVCRKIISTAPATANNGNKAFANRRRLVEGVPDGYVEPNNGGGIGPLIPSVVDLTTCPV
jgi:hypothetical protein